MTRMRISQRGWTSNIASDVRHLAAS